MKNLSKRNFEIIKRKNKYEELLEYLSKDNNFDISYVFSLFSTILYNVGSKYRDELIKENERGVVSVKEKAKLLEFSQYAYESAIKFDKYQI